jgi:hypothetical protein
MQPKSSFFYGFKVAATSVNVMTTGIRISVEFMVSAITIQQNSA